MRQSQHTIYCDRVSSRSKAKKSTFPSMPVEMKLIKAYLLFDFFNVYGKMSNELQILDALLSIPWMAW